MSSLGAKWILIAAVVASAFAAAYPPDERINLGLDLKGGAYIVMEVDPASAVDHRVGLARDRIGQRLTENGLTYSAVTVVDDQAALDVKGTDPTRRGDVMQSLRDVVGDFWNIEPGGGGDFRLAMQPELRTELESQAIESTLDILRKRIDQVGLREPQIGQQGTNRILVQLPGVEDPERVKDILEDPARLEWKAVSYPPGWDPASWNAEFSMEAALSQFGGTLPEDTEMVVQRFPDGRQRFWPLKKVAVVSGDDLRDAFPSNDQWGSPRVSFQLEQEAGKRFETFTSEHIGRIAAIVLGTKDGKDVISAPVINGRIRDSGVIEGGFTFESANDLALKLRSGAIPTEVEIIEERVIGPSLGRDSIRSGLTAGLFGFAGVLLFMVVYYRLSGVNAVVALLLNVLLVFGALGALPWMLGAEATLTLPGIAGLILTIGMAVDSNVLIFERIREELRVGKTVRAAVEQGFSRALVTILDCNVTTLVAAFFLFFYGTGPVKGFAITLTIGLLASMFTAVFVSRQIYEIVLSRRSRMESLSI
jgi:preprotein translocase subunit SecD